MMDATIVSAGEIEEQILGMCKYLRLAVAGMDTRNDWSYGCHKVESALGEFDVVTPQDKEIYADWSRQCDRFDDGRQFRDCEWNYDRLMELAKPEAIALWNKFAAIREVQS